MPLIKAWHNVLGHTVILIESGKQMKNKSLIKDYLTRATHRLAAVELLMTRESYPNVVRESQELVAALYESYFESKQH